MSCKTSYKKIYVILFCLIMIFPGIFSNVMTTKSNNLNEKTNQQNSTDNTNYTPNSDLSILSVMLLSPTNGYLTRIRSLTFTWSAAAIESDYNIVIDNTPDCSSPIIDYVTSETTYTSPILGDNIYYWRVRAQDMFHQWASWSDIWNFQIDATPPPQTVLSAPVTGTTTNDATPLLQWIPTEGAESYKLQIDDQSSFASPVYDYTVSTAYRTCSLLSEGTYFWRVRAEDAAGNRGSYSAIWSFTIDITPPDSPTLYSPIQGYHSGDNTPLMDWSSVATATLYEIQIAKTQFFSNIEFTDTTNNSLITSSILSDGWKYWRVRARDAVGNWGSYSSERTFLVDTIPPSKPTLISPTNGLASNDATPTFEWSTVLGTFQYQIQISSDESFTTIVDTGYTSNTFYTTTSLSDGDYFWRVRSQDNAANWGPYSISYLYTVDNEAPSISDIATNPENPTDEDTVTINCTVNDNHIISEVMLYLRYDSGTWYEYSMIQTSGNNYEKTPGRFLAGSLVEYYIVAVDYSMNIRTDNNSDLYYSFTVGSSDEEGPTIGLISHNPSEPNDTQTIVINCEISDPNGIHSANLSYRINEGLWINLSLINVLGANYSVSIGTFAYNDLIEYYIIANDNSLNFNLAIENNSGNYFSFIIKSSDNSGPTIEDIQHDPLSPNELQIVNITCTVSDSNGIQGVTLHYRIDSGIWINISMIHLSGNMYGVIIGTFNYDELIEYFISATDDYILHNLAIENNGENNYYFSIISSDVTSPTITDVGHEPITPTDVIFVNITCNVSDSSGIFSVTLFYRINGGEWHNASMNLVSGITYNTTLGLFDYDDYVEYYVQAIDNSPIKNESYENNGGLYFEFIVEPGDTTGPTIDSVIFAPTTPTDLELVTINCHIFDEDGLSSVYFHYRINFGPWVVYDMGYISENEFQVTIGCFGYGEYVEFYISALDNYAFYNLAVEDNSTYYYGFSVVSGEVTPPDINDLSRYPLLPTELDNITFSCDVFDNNGVQSVMLYYRIQGGNWLNASMNLTQFHTYWVTVGPFDLSNFIEYYYWAVDISPNQNIAIENNGGLYYNFTITSSDLDSPIISDVEYYPLNPTINNSIHITCNVIDSNDLQSVSLYYNINDGPWIKEEMILNSETKYEHYLQQLSLGDSIKFYIEAIDNSQAHNIAVDDNGGDYYSFTIQQQTMRTTEESSIYSLSSIVVTAIALLVLKRKKC